MVSLGRPSLCRWWYSKFMPTMTIDATLTQQLAETFAAPIGQRGRFEALFQDGGAERGGWVHRAAAVLASDLPERLEARVVGYRAEGVTRLACIAMGGEASIIGPSSESLLAIASTAPAMFRVLLRDGDLSHTRWFIISKSGSTKETRNNASYVELRYRAIGLDPTQFLIYVTDPNTHPDSIDQHTEGYAVERRELPDAAGQEQTSVGGRNTLINTPTLLARAWQFAQSQTDIPPGAIAGYVRGLLQAQEDAHVYTPGRVDHWVRAAQQVAQAFSNGSPTKIALVQPAWMRADQWVWQQQNPEESLGKQGAGCTVYTTCPDLATLAAHHDTSWVFVALQVQGDVADATATAYVEAARAQDHPVVTIPVAGATQDVAEHVAAFGWMKFVAVLGAIWNINFSNQPPVEKYKARMREKTLTLDDAIGPAGDAVSVGDGITLIYDGLLALVPDEQRAAILQLQQAQAATTDIYAALLRALPALDAQTIAYYDMAAGDVETWLERLTQDEMHRAMGYAAKWGEGTGVLHGLFVNWFSGCPHQIPIHIVAKEHALLQPPYPEGGQVLQEGAIAAHLALVEERRPSVMLIVDGQLDTSGRAAVGQFFADVRQALA
jgi:hypothetical protein